MTHYLVFASVEQLNGRLSKEWRVSEETLAHSCRERRGVGLTLSLSIGLKHAYAARLGAICAISPQWLGTFWVGAWTDRESFSFATTTLEKRRDEMALEEWFLERLPDVLVLSSEDYLVANFERDCGGELWPNSMAELEPFFHWLAGCQDSWSFVNVPDRRTLLGAP